MTKVPLHKENAIGAAIDAMDMSTHQLGKRLVAAANAGEEVAVRFVEAIRSGPSTAFLAECYELSKGFRHIQTPTYRQGARQFRWFSHYEYPQKPGKDWAYALIVMRLVNAKVTDRIKQCANVQCDRYFYGDPRRRWCTKKCGSLQRTWVMRGKSK